ncbi:MAG: AbrB/MazE/SpoVT family DNA-binding domain-containing protein [Firmicutes bacterium]|nr:AbrB/MazE/SpoVT family DNA-binding domain-containing protein [Bacillota bacterium]
MYTAKVTSKGQITLPKEVRVALKIEEGENIVIAPDPNSKGFVFQSVTMVTFGIPTISIAANSPRMQDAQELLEKLRQLIEEGNR